MKGCTHRATEALRWLSMSRYRCIERVSRSYTALLAIEGIHGNGYRWKM